MLFNTIQFVIFFIVVTTAYFSLSWKGRWILLLLASCYFYMVFKPVFILILFATIVIDYYAGIWLEKVDHPGRKKAVLIISLISNIGILAFFKYYDFLGESLNTLTQALFSRNVIPDLTRVLPAPVAEWFLTGNGQLLLPIGLSFHTFQAMSYTIEVYRGNQPAERKFGIYALYVMFYPQLVAGPIERPQNMLHQFHSYFAFDFDNLKAGLMQMAFGMFKKVVIADRLAMVVDHAFANTDEQNGLSLLVAMTFYSFQIYCDFSGYSDIAIGAARVMGFKLMTNFRSPYESASISEFWSRWHISLSSWFRDYLYIPLGGNRKGEFRRQINLFTVFLVSGLWHGTSWNFVIWGAIHGVLSVGGEWYRKNLKKLGLYFPENKLVRVWNVVFTFGLVTLAWVFFRNSSGPVERAFTILKKIFTLSWSSPLDTPLNSAEMGFSLFLILFLLVKEHYYPAIPTKNTAVSVLIFVLLVLAVLLLGVFNSNQFIYFQF
jgi:alginate O-acetyltransferase complex protein AlgI